MFNKIKLLIKQNKCKHESKLIKWHWVHYPNYEPLSVEAEYVCCKCDKKKYLHIYGKEADEWVVGRGKYKVI